MMENAINLTLDKSDHELGLNNNESNNLFQFFDFYPSSDSDDDVDEDDEVEVIVDDIDEDDEIYVTACQPETCLSDSNGLSLAT